MKKIDDFSNESITNFGSKLIFGGLKDIATELKNDDNQVTYTDVHHDNDNDGKWSPGDSFDLTMV